MKINVSSSDNPERLAKPLTAALALGQIPAIQEPRVIDDWVLWLEQRPNEGGRTTVLIRPWGRPDLSAQELTPAPINVRSRVHVYGGGAVATARQGNQLIMTWIDDSDGFLWTQSFAGLSNKRREVEEAWLTLTQHPICICSIRDCLFADGLIDLSRQRWVGVMEAKGRDYLVVFSLDKEHQDPNVLYCPEDFAGYAALSPDSQQLVWVEWQQPAMPWDASQLWWAQLDDAGEIKSKVLLAGSRFDQESPISVFQPFWLSNGELVVAEDSSGWWNLMVTGPHLQPDQSIAWRRLWPKEAEFAMPQWIYGMSTSSSSGQQILSANCEKGVWKLNLLGSDGRIAELKQPFDDLFGVNSYSNRAVLVASNSVAGSGLLEIDLEVGSWKHTPISKPLLQDNEISVAEPFWFEGFGGELTHSWYYPPSNGYKGDSPLLVKSHSGPTAMATRGLNLGIQFWTSRGWGVVDVNYGGSTGFGREYRQRLQNGWGEVDVFDCAAAAKALINLGRADRKRVAIEGGSAGGFTTLACLAFTDIFRVGACRYGVSDLTAMSKDTHRFESTYLDHLLGSFVKNKERYVNRSPVNNAHKIKCPVIFFQGLQDKVVLAEQTEKMAAVLRENNLPVEVYTFAEEGHGFRNSQVKIKVLEETEKFFRKHLLL